MTDYSFVVKNGLTVNGSFTANSTIVNAPTVNATSLTVGANVVVNSTTVYVGTASVNTAVTAGQVSISGATVNSTIYSGTANNANNLGGTSLTTLQGQITGNAGAAYTNATTFAANASNITNGTLPNARLDANVVNTSAAFTITGMHTYSNGITIANTITANGANGTSGQLLTSAGATGKVYWSSNLSVSDLVVSGNLTVSGTLASVNTTNLSVTDPLIKLANGNSVDAQDIGFYGVYSGTSYTGLFRDASDSGRYKLFTGSTEEPTTTVNVSSVGYTQGTLVTYLDTGAGFIANSTAVNITAGASVSSTITANNVTITNNVAVSGVANVVGNVTVGSSGFFVGNAVYLTTVNATNITTGTLPNARLDANVVNTSAAFTITGIHTHQANLHTGNAAVNTQISNSIVLISNSTTTTALGLTDLRLGNTTTNVVISNTVSSFGGNVSVTGVANVTGNVTLGSSSFFVGNAVYLTTVNATNITTGNLPDARLSSAVVNTSGNFTIAGIHTHTANLHTGSSTVNTQISNSVIQLSNSTTTTTVGLTDVRVGNTTTNVVISNTVSSFGGNLAVTGVANVTGNVTVGSSSFFVGNAVYLTTVNATSITTGTLPDARLSSAVVNTSGAFTFTGLDTFQANLHTGNAAVNTQISNSIVLISNSTTTTSLGLADIRVGNTTTNVVVSNTVSSFGGNLAVTGVANVTGNVTLGSSAFFVGNGNYVTTLNASAVATGTIPDARLSSAVVNTSGNFTVAGNLYFTGANNYYSTGLFVSTISAGSNGVAVNATSITIGNSTVNSVYGVGTLTINGSTIANSGGANNAFNLGGIGAASYVNSSQLSSNLTNYQTTAGLSANVVTLTSNNASYLGGVAAVSYVQNTDSRVLSGNLNFTGANNYYNTGLFVSTISAGSNGVAINATSIVIGNSTVNSTLSATSFTGTASNATNLNSQPGSYYTNATNITTGTLPVAQLPANLVFWSNTNTFSAAQVFQANVTVNTTLYVVAAGNVGISNSAPAYKLHVQGDIYASGDITSASDIALKDNIEEIDPVTAFDILKSLRPVSYVMKDDETKSTKYGLIAQEVESVLPSIVKGKPGKGMSIGYMNLIAILVEAVKDLSDKYEELKRDR